MTTVNVARDFTRFPSGRLAKHGSTSGEAFRDRFLVPALEHGETVTVELDGVIGYGSSFLEEAFGGTVRVMRKPAAEVLQHLVLVTSDAVLAEEIRTYINEAGAALTKR